MIANCAKMDSIDPKRIEQQDEISFRTAIIILNFNRAKDTINLCAGIIENLSSNYSVIVVDNCSDDENELVDYVNLKNGFVTNLHEGFEEVNNRLFLINAVNNLGYAKGNNLGLRMARSMGFSRAFIVNPDVIITDYNVFESLNSIISSSEKKLAIIGPELILPDGSKQLPYKFRPDYRMAIFNFLYPLSSAVIKYLHHLQVENFGYHDVYLVIGCFFCMDLNVFSLCGYFDESTFLYYEEAIIAERIKRIGYNIGYAPHFSVIHNHVYSSEWEKKTCKLMNTSREFYQSVYLKTSRIENAFVEVSSAYQKVLHSLIKLLRRSVGNNA